MRFFHGESAGIKFAKSSVLKLDCQNNLFGKSMGKMREKTLGIINNRFFVFGRQNFHGYMVRTGK
jgi:hypothetical protein